MQLPAHPFRRPTDALSHPEHVLHSFQQPTFQSGQVWTTISVSVSCIRSWFETHTRSSSRTPSHPPGMQLTSSSLRRVRALDGAIARRANDSLQLSRMRFGISSPTLRIWRIWRDVSLNLKQKPESKAAWNRLSRNSR